MTLRSPDGPPPSAKDYYAQVFKPSYDAFLESARQTPLVIMLWGPRRPSLAWSKTRLQIRNTLQQMGHTVYLSEQLGIPATASTQKAVEYLQRDAVDLIVAIQSSYGLVGTVNQFVEFRVIDSKMLLFIDAAASDKYLYDRAAAELKNLYDNVETFNLPDDIVRDTLFRKIAAKISLMQIVKHRAIQRARGWSLRLESPVTPGASLAPLATFSLQPARALSRTSRRDRRVQRSHAFVLCSLSKPRRAHLAQSLFEGYWIGRTLADATNCTFAARRDDIPRRWNPGRFRVWQTDFGGAESPSSRCSATGDQGPRVLPPIMRTRLATFTAGAGLALAAIFLFALALLNSVNPVQNRQPLVLTPLPAITSTATLVPAPTLTPPPGR